MIKEVSELIYVQVAYAIILGSILWLSRKKGKVRIAYWSITACYVCVVCWLSQVFINFGSHPDPGRVFAWAMTSIMLPGAFALGALIIFIAYRVREKRR
jgi:hypothetical protein